MTILKKCASCKTYTLSEECKKCGEKTSDAHYKFRERFLKSSEHNNKSSSVYNAKTTLG
ncbi:MAG TPA: nucleolar RNA-binding Nop10p family protein [Candidatus Nanoarchaeia archaeon]|nr:nucleolar RNA-binding Nop10p family protein [Candidatus Nanoarchaeia archaeon]